MIIYPDPYMLMQDKVLKARIRHQYSVIPLKIKGNKIVVNDADDSQSGMDDEEDAESDISEQVETESNTNDEEDLDSTSTYRERNLTTEEESESGDDNILTFTSESGDNTEESDQEEDGIDNLTYRTARMFVSYSD